MGFPDTYTCANYGFSSSNWDMNDEIGVKIFSDQTMELYPSCGNEGSQKTIIYKPIKAQKDVNNIYIYQKILFVTPKEQGENILYEIYDNYQLTGSPKETLSSAKLFNNEYNVDLYKTYKFSFEKLENEYYF